MNRTLATTLAAVGAVSAAGLAGAVWAAGIEPELFRIRRSTVAVLPPGAEDLRILHISDLHLCAWQKRKMEFVSQLAELEPDLIVNTGDNLAAPMLERLLEVCEELLDVPGVFVLGSNDFFAPQLKNPLRYLGAPSEVKHSKKNATLPTMELVDAFAERGWAFLDNRGSEIELRGTRLAFAGTGDAHMNRDRIDEEWPRFDDPTADVRIGVTHAPYLRVLDAFAAAEADLAFAGHTHGGQVCVPFYGALVTNCDLPARHAKGTFDYHGMTVNVSAGLGFSPFAPVRFACPPEVSLITLTARS
ncbi:metallophosphoesterase [Brevibacterium luteolum]|nr:metallophosphoesterase [Brevibacterium luteolum]